MGTGDDDARERELVLYLSAIHPKYKKLSGDRSFPRQRRNHLRVLVSNPASSKFYD